MKPELSAVFEMLGRVKSEVARVLVGQDGVVDAMLTGLLTGGHILLEGVPGLAKTLAVKTLARTIGLSFSRIQFTPDLLPSDITGTTVFLPAEQRFEARPGPVCANLILADEVNRAPAKVQSALLEAMQERQVTIGMETFRLPEPFLVVATENPIEQSGTYPLPEAQKDRFMLQVILEYPDRDEEAAVIERIALAAQPPGVAAVASADDITSAAAILHTIHYDPVLTEYVLDIVTATRPGYTTSLSPRQKDFDVDITHLIETGASPRASIAIVKTSRALALLRGRDYVVPDDVRNAAELALPHRIIPTYEAEAEHLSAIKIVQQLLDHITPP